MKRRFGYFTYWALIMSFGMLILASSFIFHSDITSKHSANSSISEKRSIASRDHESGHDSDHEGADHLGHCGDVIVPKPVASYCNISSTYYWTSVQKLKNRPLPTPYLPPKNLNC